MTQKLTYLVLSSCFVFGMGCGDDGGGDVDAAVPDAAALVQDCPTYCTLAATNCADANSQYNPDFCAAVCDTWELGTAADTAGNTLGCHIYHATAAAEDPATHCLHAGPTGAGVCGDPCDNFCELAMASCVDANEQFGGDMATCLAECGAFNTDPPYSAAETGGDSQACRFYHLTAAATDPGTHCGHIVTASGPCQ